MTEQEAINVMEKYTDITLSKVVIKAHNMAIVALEEIQQYRAIGSPERIIKLLESGADTLENSKDILDSVIKELYKYKAIGTVEECREAVEKQRAKKPKTRLRHRGGFEVEHCPNCDTDYQVDRRYTINDDYCPCCGKLLDSTFKSFCGNCGQAMEVK